MEGPPCPVGSPEDRALAGVLERSSQAFAVGNLDNTFGWFNSAFQKLTGYSAEELRALDWSRALTPPEAREPEQRALAELRRTGQPVRYEKEYVRKDGTRVALDFHVHLVCDASGQPTHYEAFITDLTAHKATAAKLRESEALWQFATEGSGDGVWDLNVQTSQVYYSRQSKAMLGYAETEIGDTLQEWDQRVHPEDKAQVYADLQAHLSGQTPLYVNEHRVRRKDDSWLWVLDRGKVMTRTPDGRPLRVVGTHTDISAGKQMEVQMRQWADAFAHCAHGIALGSPATGRVLTCNPAFARLFERKVEEVVGQLILGLYAPEERERVLGCIAEADDRGSARYEARMVRGDGRTFPAQVDLVAVRDDEGHSLYRVATAQDITVRQQAEAALAEARNQLEGRVQRRTAELAVVNEALRLDIVKRQAVEASLLQSEERLQMALEVTNTVVWEIDPATDQMIEVGAVASLFGGAASPSPQPLSAFLQRVHPDDQKPVLAHYARTVREQGELQDEFRIVQPNGAVRWLAINGRMLSAKKGRPLRVVGLIRDVTEKRRTLLALSESEATLHNFYDHVPLECGILELLPGDFLFISVNATAAASFGCRPEELVGRQVSEWAPRAINMEDWAKHCRVAQQTREAQRFEYGHPGATPARTFRAIVAFLQITGTGRSQFTFLVEDITEQKLLEAKFIQAQRLESVGALASGIAHDLNNALFPVQMCVYMLREPGSEAERLEWLETIDTAAARSTDIIRQVLSFARGQADQVVPTDLRLILNETTRLFRATQPQTVTVHAVLPKNLWPVQGNATRLHQMLMNLCVNAADAMPHGGRVTITAENVPANDERAGSEPGTPPRPWVALSVADTGIGMTPEVQAQIFEPFFTTKAHGRGTGLGLPTVNAIVQNHGGILRVASQPQQGTTFTIYLPALDPGQLRAVGEKLNQAPPGHGEHVLIVDDEPAVREALKTILKQAGYHPHTAADGAEAVVVMAENRHRIQAVILDLDMPVLGGAEVIPSLTKFNPRLQIIILSGQLELQERAKPLGKAVSAVLAKPCGVQELLHTLDRVLENNMAP